MGNLEKPQFFYDRRKSLRDFQGQGAAAWNAASRLPGMTTLGLLAGIPRSQPISPGDLEPPEDPEEFDPECH